MVRVGREIAVGVAWVEGELVDEDPLELSALLRLDLLVLPVIDFAFRSQVVGLLKQLTLLIVEPIGHQNRDHFVVGTEAKRAELLLVLVPKVVPQQLDRHTATAVALKFSR